MTPTLIETVLALPLPVRVALLDTDPKGAGWFISRWGRAIFKTAGHSIESVTDGTGVWLPCNPLPVVRVAANILAARHGLTPSIELLGPDGHEDEPEWTCRLVVASNIQVEAAGSREEIGVLVLREVCRG